MIGRVWFWVERSSPSREIEKRKPWRKRMVTTREKNHASVSPMWSNLAFLGSNLIGSIFLLQTCGSKLICSKNMEFPSIEFMDLIFFFKHLYILISEFGVVSMSILRIQCLWKFKTCHWFASIFMLPLLTRAIVSVPLIKQIAIVDRCVTGVRLLSRLPPSYWVPYPRSMIYSTFIYETV